MRKETVKKRSRILLAIIIALVLAATALIVAFGEKEPTLEINAANVSFEGTVHLWYCVGYENIEDPENIKLLVWDEDDVDHISKCTLGTEKARLSTSGYVNEDKVVGQTFDYEGLAAAEMTKNEYVRAYAEVNGKAV